LHGVGVEHRPQLRDRRRDVGGAGERHVGAEAMAAGALPDGGVAVAVPRVLDDLEPHGLLGTHPRRLDGTRDHALALRVDQHVGHALGGDLVHPAVAAPGVPGEVGRTAQDDRTEPALLHQCPHALTSEGAPVVRRGVAHAR
jgi:hypothetical protein